MKVRQLPCKIHNLVQGSPEWDQFRLEHHGASEAGAMLGISPNTKRDELLFAKHTGIPKEFSAFVQENVLDKGHEVEAKARPIVEELIGEELYPVTCSRGKLSASCDGLTMSRKKAMEHKQWNVLLAAEVSAGRVPDYHMGQCQQIMLVTPAESVIFVVSDGTRDNMVYVEVMPDEAWFDRIELGWEQFDKDLAEFVPAEVVDKPVGKVATSLPAVFVEVSGALAVSDNFKLFGAELTNFIEHELIVKPESDQDFADMALQIRALEKAEAALDAAEAHMISQVQAVDTFKRAKEMLYEMARSNRLAAQKRLDARKLAIKGEIVVDGANKFSEHIEALNKRLGKPYMPSIRADFAGAIKNLRTVESLRNAVNTELARVKILANETADRIDANLKHLQEHASEHKFLFSDTATIVLKAPDDLQALVANRINEHKAAEQQKQDELREQIRKEEADRLEREAEAKRKAEAIEKTAMEARNAIEQARAGESVPPILLAELEKTVDAIAPVKAQETMPESHVTRVRTTLHAQALESSQPQEDEKPTLKLGEITVRLGFIVNADFLAELGYTATTERGAKLYRESDFPAICDAIRTHIVGVREQHAYKPRAGVPA